MAKASKARHERRVAKLTEELKGLQAKLIEYETKGAYAMREADRYAELGFTLYAEYLRCKAEYEIEQNVAYFSNRIHDTKCRISELTYTTPRPLSIGQQIEKESREWGFLVVRV